MKRLTLTLASTTFAFLLAAGGEGEPEATTLNFDALDPPPELSLLVKAKQ